MAEWDAGDHLEIRLKGGGTAIIPRGDMTDDEWLSVVQKARDNNTFSKLVQSRKDTVADRPFADVGRAQRRPTETDTPESDFMEVKVGDRTAIVPRGNMTKEEWASAKERASKQKILVVSHDSEEKRQEDLTGKKKSGGGILQNIKSAVENLTTGAAPQEAAGEEEIPAALSHARAKVAREKAGEEGLPGMVKRAIPEISALNENVGQTIKETAQDTASTLMSASPITAPFAPAPVPGGKGGPAALAEAAGGAVKALPMIGPAISLMGGGAQPGIGPQSGAAPLPPGAVPAIGAQNAGPPPLVAPPGPGAQSGAMSLSVKSQTPGAGGPAGYSREEKMILDATEQQKAAIKAHADLEGAKLAGQAKIIEDGIRQQTAIADREQKRREMIDSRMQQATNAYEQTINSFMQQDFKIDPGRYWSTIGSERQALWVIAGMFSRGRSNAQLGQMIETDISAQKAEVQLKGEALRAKAGAQVNLIGMFRQQGLDSYEAEKAARATLWEGIKARVEQVEKQSDSAAAPAKAQELMALANQKQAKELIDLKAHREADAQRWAQINLDRQEFALKLRESGGGPGGRPIRSAEAGDLGNVESAHTIAKNLRAEFGDKGTGARMLDKLLGEVPKTKAAEFNRKRDLALNYIGRMVDGSVLQKHDLERWEKMLPKSGDLMGENTLDILVEDIRITYNARLESMSRAGYDVKGLRPIPPGAGEDPYGKVIR